METILSRRAALQALTAGVASAVFAYGASAADSATTAPAGKWMGIHLMTENNHSLDQLSKQVPALAGIGINALILEIDYGFDFKCDPGLGEGGITSAAAKKFADLCRQHRIRVIPQLDCLGHQSWEKTTAALLSKYPELDETPGQFPDNKGIYCRSWCPRHPKLGQIVFPLLDELADAFHADAVHVGMDEVFLISSEHCPRCRGTDPAESFALAVNDLHAHLVDKRKLTMMMWGDRLLDGKATGYGKWEASENGTHPAIDKIPTDIVICDWHYEKRAEYPSIPLFAKKGFAVWPSSWKSAPAAEALHAYATTQNSEKLLGQLFTTWGAVKPDGLATWPPIAGVVGKPGM